VDVEEPPSLQAAVAANAAKPAIVAIFVSPSELEKICTFNLQSIAAGEKRGRDGYRNWICRGG